MEFSKKTNVIYAPNGSGKTSLAVLFNSLSGNNELVLKKKSFGTDYFPEIKFLSSRKEVKYVNKKWNTFIPNIEVFDSFYMEENIYTIIVEDKVNKLNIFEYSHADEIIGIKKEIFIIKKRRTKLSKNIKGIKTGIKKGRISADERIKNILDQRITERGACETKIREL
jgi:energy-coupling factor transporter ATP-binding protein EcfA2